MVDTPDSLLASAPVRERRIDSVAIVDGTLVPTRDRRLSTPSKNYRYSTNLPVAIDADTSLVFVTGDRSPVTATTALRIGSPELTGNWPTGP